ncbi:MAG TPA: hypothetical protein VIO11_04180 [Candidatus Methanoperedens sp.]
MKLGLKQLKIEKAIERFKKGSMSLAKLGVLPKVLSVSSVWKYISPPLPPHRVVIAAWSPQMISHHSRRCENSFHNIPLDLPLIFLTMHYQKTNR